jgi:hypothetical protein
VIDGPIRQPVTAEFAQIASVHRFHVRAQTRGCSGSARQRTGAALSLQYANGLPKSGKVEVSEFRYNRGDRHADNYFLLASVANRPMKTAAAAPSASNAGKPNYVRVLLETSITTGRAVDLRAAFRNARA